jgi:hypothetical protein
VAKNVTLHAVRVLACDGTAMVSALLKVRIGSQALSLIPSFPALGGWLRLSQFVWTVLSQGLEWVAKNHIKPAVVHMSIEGGFSSIVNQAVEQLIKVNHVHVVVSSGGHCSLPAAASWLELPPASVTPHNKRRY